MARVLVTLKLDPKQATINQVIRSYKLAQSEIDKEYGIVNISPDEHLYVALIDEKAAQRLHGAKGMRGAYSNPKIEPFGPPSP